VLLYDEAIQKSTIHQGHYDNKHHQSITPGQIAVICNITVHFSLCNTQTLMPVINPLNAKLNPIYHLLALLEAHHILHISRIRVKLGWHNSKIIASKKKTLMPFINALNAKLNPICHLLALLEAHHILHVSRIRIKLGWHNSKIIASKKDTYASH